MTVTNGEAVCFVRSDLQQNDDIKVAQFEMNCDVTREAMLGFSPEVLGLSRDLKAPNDDKMQCHVNLWQGTRHGHLVASYTKG